MLCIARASMSLLGFLACACLFPSSPSQTDSSHGSWKLVWADEFNGRDGSGVDTSKWQVNTQHNGFGNDELEGYTGRRENLREVGGNLVIEARKEHYLGPDGQSREFTSGRIDTDGKFSQTYGRFEARMKLPLGKGLWPAFWLLGGNVGSAGWPACGEIDIMENIGAAHRVYGTLHGPGYSGSHGPQGSMDLPAAQAVDTGFHVYAVEWSPGETRFLVDGQVYATKTRQDIPAGTNWVFDHPFFVLFDLAVGGRWPGNPDSTTRFPQQMLVDYVRVYARGN